MLLFWYDLCRYPKNSKMLVIVNSCCFEEKSLRSPKKQTQNSLEKCLTNVFSGLVQGYIPKPPRKAGPDPGHSLHRVAGLPLLLAPVLDTSLSSPPLHLHLLTIGCLGRIPACSSSSCPPRRRLWRARPPCTASLPLGQRPG